MINLIYTQCWERRTNWLENHSSGNSLHTYHKIKQEVDQEILCMWHNYICAAVYNINIHIEYKCDSIGNIYFYIKYALNITEQKYMFVMLMVVICILGQ